MNKSELIEHIADRADISKAAAARALEAVLEGVTDTLKKGEPVSLVGFGTFAVASRAAPFWSRCSRWKAMRWADLGPTPGRQRRASMRTSRLEGVLTRGCRQGLRRAS